MSELERMQRALVAADAAGDTEAATKIAQAIRSYQPPANTGWAGERRALGLGVRDVAQGLGALPGMVYDAAAVPVNLAISGVNALGGNVPRVRTAEQNIDTAADVVGLPRAETQSERIASGIVRGGAAALTPAGIAARFAQAPGAVGNVATMLATNPGTQVVAGASGGGAQSMAAESGAGPIAQTAAGIGGSLMGGVGFEALKAGGRLGRAAFEPFTQAGRDRITGNTIYGSAANPESLVARLQAGIDDPNRRVPGAPATTAQASQDVGLAALEAGMRNDAIGANSPGVLLRGVEFERNAARQRALQGLNPLPGADTATRGGTVRTALSEAEKANLPGGAGNFVRQFLNRATGQADDFYGNLDNLAAQRSQAARPLYEKAMNRSAWSPRVDDFINDPIAKQGLARGYEIQRLESAARGQPFNPRQMGVDLNAQGEPVFVGRPNMRALDMVKAGLDDIIETYRDKTTGRLVLDRRGNAVDEFRRAYVSTLDDVNPDYRAARQAWSGPSQAMDAQLAGREALRLDPEQVAKRMATMSEGDRDFYRAGLLRDLQDMFARGDAQAFAVFRDSNKRKTLETVFGRENIEALAGHLNSHAARFGRDGSGANAVGRILASDAGGSPTLPLGNVGSGALQSPQSVRQVLSAIPDGPQRDQVRKALQSEFIDRFNAAAQTTNDIVGPTGQTSRGLSPAGARRFYEQNAAVAREIFSPQELAQLNRLMSDFGETASLQATAAARGSPTAQNLIVGNMVSRATGGLVDPANPAAQTIAGVGPAMRLLYAAPEAAVRENLARALADPQEALRFLQAAGPQGAQQGAAYLNQSMKDRLAQALMGEAARFVPRAANVLTGLQ